MKRCQSLFVSGAWVVALTAMSLPAFAGPGPQSGAQRGKSPVDQGTPKCSTCKTVALEEPVYGYFPGGEIDDYRIQWVKVGSKHTCSGCRGEIKAVKGTTASDMQSNCPVCRQTVPSCCKVSG